MNNIFVKRIKINKVRHLSGIDIPVSEGDTFKHVIFTGKNGSGKTSVVELMAQYIEGYDWADIVFRLSPQIELEMNISTSEAGASHFHDNNVLAYYGSHRIFTAAIPQQIEKVSIKSSYGMSETPGNEFLKLLLDMKMTQALAAMNGNSDQVQEIDLWFSQLENILRDIYEDNTLKLQFDANTFEFKICTKGHEPFGFNEASDGFSAILDIVLDIMIRCQVGNSRITDFKKPGIVIIDEIENHLHLKMQRTIMGYLTGLFPNIQFIVTTHSPFILNSIDNAVIYDLENRILVTDGLTNVTYAGIVDSYFNTDELSEKLREKFNRFKYLVREKHLTDEELVEIEKLEIYLDEIPDYLSVGIATEYKRLKLEFEAREDF